MQERLKREESRGGNELVVVLERRDIWEENDERRGKGKRVNREG